MTLIYINYIYRLYAQITNSLIKLLSPLGVELNLFSVNTHHWQLHTFKRFKYFLMMCIYVRLFNYARLGVSVYRTDPWSWSYAGGVTHWCGWWELNQEPLQKQQWLLAASPAPTNLVLWSKLSGVSYLLALSVCLLFPLPLVLRNQTQPSEDAELPPPPLLCLYHSYRVQFLNLPIVIFFLVLYVHLFFSFANISPLKYPYEVF